jgi:glycosyltransferase involved in cell wall biosynthesis
MSNAVYDDPAMAHPLTGGSVARKPLVSIVVPCYNEEGNVEILYERLSAVFAKIPDLNFQIIFIDNASVDRTQELLRSLASRDPRVKAIFNIRNFGVVRSGLNGFFESPGDALVNMACDLQDPPELVEEFVRLWRGGFKVVIGVKPQSRESPLMYLFRSWYYRTLNTISETPLIENFTGFGLYDREVVETLRRIPDRRPYLRGLIAELGYIRAEVPFVQPKRERGVTSNNFYSLYDVAMMGVTSHSRVPLRLATMAGFLLGCCSLLVALIYLVAKLLFWKNFAMGQAPVLIGVFFFGSVQLFFVGILGEYIGAIHSQVHPRPWVIERERLNFDRPSADDSK